MIFFLRRCCSFLLALGSCCHNDSYSCLFIVFVFCFFDLSESVDFDQSPIWFWFACNHPSLILIRVNLCCGGLPVQAVTSEGGLQLSSVSFAVTSIVTQLIIHVTKSVPPIDSLTAVQHPPPPPMALRRGKFNQFYMCGTRDPLGWGSCRRLHRCRMFCVSEDWKLEARINTRYACIQRGVTWGVALISLQNLSPLEFWDARTTWTEERKTLFCHAFVCLFVFYHLQLASTSPQAGCIPLGCCCCCWEVSCDSFLFTGQLWSSSLSFHAGSE